VTPPAVEGQGEAATGGARGLRDLWQADYGRRPVEVKGAKTTETCENTEGDEEPPVDGR
jgi:hypothetical protein